MMRKNYSGTYALILLLMAAVFVVAALVYIQTGNEAAQRVLFTLNQLIAIFTNLSKLLPPGNHL